MLLEVLQRVVDDIPAEEDEQGEVTEQQEPRYASFPETELMFLAVGYLRTVFDVRVFDVRLFAVRALEVDDRRSMDETALGSGPAAGAHKARPRGTPRRAGTRRPAGRFRSRAERVRPRTPARWRWGMLRIVLVSGSGMWER